MDDEVSMRLDDGQHGAFELTIDRYEFPDSTGDWDGDWLIVCGRVTHPRGDWTFRDPCLTTLELEQLASWFEGIAQGQADPAGGFFTEPNLRFQYADTPSPEIRLTLAYESAPPWLSGRHERLDGTVMAFPVALNDPRGAARSLRALLARYPAPSVFEAPE